jgi:hypothetical protein
MQTTSSVKLDKVNPDAKSAAPLMSPEKLSAARAAIATTELARINIEHYMNMQGARELIGPRAHFVMKIAEEANAGVSKLVNDSATLAAETLKAFVDSHKKG